MLALETQYEELKQKMQLLELAQEQSSLSNEPENEATTSTETNLVPRLFLRERKDPGRSWSRATQILGGKLKQHLGRGGRVLRLENYNLCA